VSRSQPVGIYEPIETEPLRWPPDHILGEFDVRIGARFYCGTAAAEIGPARAAMADALEYFIERGCGVGCVLLGYEGEPGEISILYAPHAPMPYWASEIGNLPPRSGSKPLNPTTSTALHAQLDTHAKGADARAGPGFPPFLTDKEW
jgi:hypothetical protein